MAASQDEVIAFLSRPESYGPDVDRVERTETQISIVFLAGDRAYKLLRAVELSFLDFTALETRRRTSEAGLKLNRRMAPELYLSVIPVTREADGGFALGGAGDPADYVIEMRRFDADCLFDRLLEAGRLTPELMDRLAEKVDAFHAAETPVIGGEAGGPEALRRVLENNVREIERPPAVFPPKEAGRLHDRLRGALENASPILERRKATGRVRHCHGDLHLRNIVLWKGAPLLFDCLEFDRGMATIDVLYDLAFLVMDLDARGRRDLANRVLGRALLLSDDYAGLAVLPLYLALRSHIRAFVAAGAAAVADSPGKMDRHEREARGYFLWAGTYLEAPPARLVALGGLSGSGKTTLGTALAPRIGAPPGALHLRSDVLRKHLAGVGDRERLPREAYGKESSEEVYRELRRRAASALRAGHSVVLDAVHARPEERAAAEAVAREAGAAFTGLWLEAPKESLVGRVRDRRGDASDATPDVVETQLGYELGEIGWTRIDASGGAEASLTAAEGILFDAETGPRERREDARRGSQKPES